MNGWVTWDRLCGDLHGHSEALWHSSTPAVYSMWLWPQDHAWGAQKGQQGSLPLENSSSAAFGVTANACTVSQQGTDVVTPRPPSRAEAQPPAQAGQR